MVNIHLNKLIMHYDKMKKSGVFWMNYVQMSISFLWKKATKRILHNFPFDIYRDIENHMGYKMSQFHVSAQFIPLWMQFSQEFRCECNFIKYNVNKEMKKSKYNNSDKRSATLMNKWIEIANYKCKWHQSDCDSGTQSFEVRHISNKREENFVRKTNSQLHERKK